MLINCLPHDVVVIEGDKTIVIPASGNVIRVTEEVIWIKQLEGVPGTVTKMEFSEPVGIPLTEPGDILIVSAIVAQCHWMKVYASTHGLTLISPDTGKSAKRDENNQIVAVYGFRKF